MTRAISRCFLFCAMLSGSALATPLVVGHRGASAQAPENTLAAFKLAWEQGADAVECDVWMTRDAKLVCIHDRDTKRVSDRILDVRKATLSELKQLDVGRWWGKEWEGERIPTLSEVLATVPKGKKIFVEIKGRPAIVSLLSGVLKESRLSNDQVIVISFDKEVIRRTRKTLSNLKALLLVDFDYNRWFKRWSPSAARVIRDMKATRAHGVDVPVVEPVNEAFIKQVRAAGGEVHVWTVNDRITAKRYTGYGIDSITTNNPKMMKGFLQELQKEQGAQNGKRRD